MGLVNLLLLFFLYIFFFLFFILINLLLLLKQHEDDLLNLVLRHSFKVYLHNISLFIYQLLPLQLCHLLFKGLLHLWWNLI